jgi:hypothetical protein
LKVLSAEGGQDFAGVQIMHCSLVRIEPDPHGVLALTIELDVRYACQTGEYISNVKGYVIR